MANSLKAKLSKLRYEGHITNAQYYEICSKLAGHDKVIEKNLISRIENAMYNEAFIQDSLLQKWEGGCWIRYKLFENVIERIKREVDQDE